MNELKDIAKAQNNQVPVVKRLAKKLLQKLPKNLEETAKAYGAIARKRVIKSAVDLILALFIYASPGTSLRLLAASTAIIGIANMSDQAWQKKVINCEPWLSHLLEQTVPKMSNKSKKAFNGKTVKLLDGSVVRQAGKLGKKGGEYLRIHMCYNLTAGNMEGISITDKYTAEGVTVFDLEPDVIYIADAVYGKGRMVSHIISCQADALFRATPNHLRLTADQKGKSKIDMAQKLNTKSDIIDFSCYIHTENKRYIPIRIVASKLPEDKALLARERKLRNARKEQTKNIRQETLIYAGWIVLITTLGDAYSPQTLLKMYRARWQIELLFKRIKQSFDVSVLPAASLTHSKVMVLLWLILWALTEKEALSMEILLLGNDTDMTLYSPWSMQRFLFRQLMTVINSLWALCFDNLSFPNISIIFDRLRNHRSSRVNQFSDFRFASAGFICV